MRGVREEEERFRKGRCNDRVLSLLEDISGPSHAWLRYDPLGSTNVPT